jgi:2'-5' RNA ligase
MGEAQRAFHVLQTILQPWSSILRFQNPDSPHLTVYFWREMMQIEYSDVRSVAQKIAERTRPFTVATSGIETFGDKRGDRVLFLGVQFSPELAAIRKLCPWPNVPGTSFHPHITVARINHPERFTVAKKKVMKATEKIEFPITFDRLRLYAEIDGMKQTALEEFVFGPS